MSSNIVSLVTYEEPYRSVRKAVEESSALANMPAGARVFIKPNIVFWTRHCRFPKWGVITTSRVVQDMVALLKEHGASQIVIGEGIVTSRESEETAAHAFFSLGYKTLEKRYGVKIINIMERPFEKIDLGDGISLKYNTDLLSSDYFVNLPVLKSHNQTVVSLSIKNIKGAIDISSRKKCHSADPEKDLHFHVAKLTSPLPPAMTLIDGIYSLERGPAFDGRMRRSNLLIASADLLSADMIGAKVLGYEPDEVPHLKYAALWAKRLLSCSDIEVRGREVKEAASLHSHDFEYICGEDGEMPAALYKAGIKGLFYRKFDQSMCTYCSALNGLILTSVRRAWQGESWDSVEILTGKVMEPTAGMNATILIGQCMVTKNKDHPNARNVYAAGGCPPDPKAIVGALNEAGIKVDHSLFEQADLLPGFFMSRYADKPEFEESFFTIS